MNFLQRIIAKIATPKSKKFVDSGFKQIHKSEQEYTNRAAKEIENFKADEVVHDLPEIFHYWSNKYLLPKLQSFGLNHPEDLFIKKISEIISRQPTELVEILSIGAGNCDAEVRIAQALTKQGFLNFKIECLDLNSAMLSRGIELAKANGIENFITIIEGDFNEWTPSRDYDAVIANQSLHHVSNLEHLFQSIYNAIKAKNGVLITSDMIGRNGHQRWPEALSIIEEIWEELPEKYKYNHQLKRQENKFINFDCSTESFEGIRSQDVLPLLMKTFRFELFIPFANLTNPFIDRGFGHNFDRNSEFDRNIIDNVHLRDEYEINSGNIKPTQMLAILTVNPAGVPKLIGHLTPEFCVRPSNGS
jgi:SAM-dependent methyltransferase